MDRQASLFIVIGKTHIALDGQVRLALQVEAIFHHVGGRFHNRLGVRTFGDLLLEVYIRRAGVDFDGVVGHGGWGAHISGQLFQLHFDFLGRGLGLLDGIGAYDSNRVAILEDLGIAQDRPVPAVALVGGEGDQAGDAVLALDILVGDDFHHAGHLLGFGGVDRQDVGMRYLGLHQRQLQCAGGHLQPQVLAEIQRAGHFTDCGRAWVLAAPNLAIRRQLVFQLFASHLAAQHFGRIHDPIDDRLVAGAAAGVVVLGQPGAHFFSGRFRVAVQQGLG